MEDTNVNCNPSFEVDIKLNGATNILEQGLKGLDGQGFTMQGEWSENILYKPYDVVTSINGVFCCLLLNDNSEPTDENPNWHKMLDTFQSEYEYREEERVLDFNTSQLDREASYTLAENNRDELYNEKENDITYENSREYRFIDSQNKRNIDYLSKEQERENSYASSEQERENKYLIAETTGENSREERFLVAELARTNEENTRKSQEIARVDEENTRKQNELARVAEEQNRVNQEIARVDKENTRKQNELSRVAEEQNRVNQELARVDKENTRKQNELARVAEEHNRVNQELARVDKENTRKQNELSRVAEEQNRVNQELARVDKENTRKQNELARVAEEQNRVNQEIARVDEENTRKQSELARVAEEQNRVNQELARVDKENTRKQNELARVAEEQNRVNQEIARVDEENTRKQSELARVAEEQNRVNQEIARVDEENTRKQSELARVAEEQNRVNQELARVDKENTRKSQEIARQNTIAGLGDSFDAKIDKTSITQYFGSDETKVISQKGFTDNISEILQLEGEELYAYGVKWTEVQTSPTLERIGNINMHKTLPCHKVRGCLVKNDGSINYYLHPSSDLLKADGVTPSVLDGTDGDVMNYRKFYYRTAIKDGVHVNWMSPYPLQGYTLYEGFTGRYKGSINRTTGKIHSVINTTPEFRGGGNTAAWDSDGRSLLGCAVSGINRATFRSGARINRSTDWNGARGHDDNFALLIYFRVKWATHNTQLAYNAALDASGYYQGGMGSGTTNLSGAKWGGYNGYNPFIPCGYTKEFGDGSGVKAFVMPFEYDAYDTVAAAQKYTGVYSDARGYATGEYCSDGVDSYKGSGTATLYRCKADAAAGVALSNTTHFETVTRTITQAIRMDGEEQWFGEIWEFYSDVLIEMDATAQTSKCYIFRNQSQIAETRTGNEEFLCNLPITDGYVKLFNENSIFPKSTGGGSTTFGCDYTYIGFPASGVSLRGCLGGGGANGDANAGASCSASSGSPSNSIAYIGGRLVLKKRKLENQ